jgi:hypothetical protein
MVICFYCIHQSCKKRIGPKRELSSECPLQEANGVSRGYSKMVLPALIGKMNLLVRDLDPKELSHFGGSC